MNYFSGIKIVFQNYKYFVQTGPQQSNLYTCTYMYNIPMRTFRVFQGAQTKLHVSPVKHGRDITLLRLCYELKKTDV